MNKNKTVITVLVLLVLGLAGWIIYRELTLKDASQNNQQGSQQPAPKAAADFEACVAAGNPVMESYPRQCRDGAGTLHVEKVTGQPGSGSSGTDEQPSSGEFTSKKGVAIKLQNVKSGQAVSSPLKLRGEVPGNWSFEASFPVLLKDKNGRTIAQQPAQLQGDWMTEAKVPFEVTLSFDAAAKGNGTLVLQKANASGLAEHDDSLEVPVVIQ